MKTKFLSFLFIAAMIAGCTKDAIKEGAYELNSKNQPVGCNYDIKEAASVDGFYFKIVIDQSATQDISHIIFQMTDCDGNYITLENFESAIVNGVDWMSNLKSGTGQGTDCEFEEGPFVKFDDFNFDGGEVIVEFTLDVQTAGGLFKIKSGQNCCGPWAITGFCGDEPCYEFHGETAWAAGMRYVSRGNWATYTPYAEGTVKVFAGQTIEVGTATFSAIVDGMVTITIELTGDWVLEDVDEALKIQGYDVKPPAVNPAPGLFTTYKGNDLTVTVPAFNFYGIHLNVGYWFEVPCPEVE